MPLRPIDAIFVHPERRLYVVYYRGKLWQLPRMKVDDSSWQRRQPYNGPLNALYLSSHQHILDPILAQKLRTLNLPEAVRGSTLPRFEAWWEAHGFEWLKDKITTGQSPLAAHQALVHPPASSPTVNNSTATQPNTQPNDLISNTADNTTPSEQEKPTPPVPTVNSDIFADMLAELADEVIHHRS